MASFGARKYTTRGRHRVCPPVYAIIGVHNDVLDDGIITCIIYDYLDTRVNVM